MGSKAPQLKGMLQNGKALYKKLMEENKQYVQDPPTVERCQLLANQLFYTRLASIPVRCEAFWKEVETLKKNVIKNKPLLNKENGGIAALFGLECYAWFYGGEIIGRGFTITGYHV